MTRIFALLVLAFGGIVAGSAVPATAQESARERAVAQALPQSATHVEALKACKAIADSEQRLACYDQSVGAIIAATDQGEVRIVDKEDVEQARRGLFGFSIPSLKIFGDDSDGRSGETADMLQSTITEVAYLRSGAINFRIAEGDAVWQISNPPQRLRTVKKGDPVEFKKAALGTYFIRIDGQLGVKGKRLR